MSGVPDWNKEVSFRRRKPAAAPAKQSIWKKEIGRKKTPKPPGSVPWWKKEIGGGRKQKAPSAAKTTFWKKELSLGRGGGKKAPAPAPAPAAAPEPDPAPPAPPEPVEDFSWLTERLDAHVPPVEPLAWPPRSTGEPVAASWPPPSEAPPAPVAPPEPEPEPVAAAEEPAPKTPFWKRELSLGRGAPKEPKPAKVPFWKRELSVARKPKPAKEPAAGGKVPFWKRELGRPQAPKQPKPETPAAARTPFWKKELSLGGGGLALPRPRPRPRPRAKVTAPETAKREHAQLVGLKVGASQLVAARVHNNGEPHVLQVAREPLDDGVVVGGELRDVEARAEALKRLFAGNKLPRKGVRLGIANNRIGVRTFEISGIDDPKQLANAIRFRAQETLPIPLEEAVLDWQVLRERTDESGVTTRRVLLVVAYRELVDRYVLACKKAGLRLEGIDLEAFAMLRALTVPAADGEASVGAQVVVNVGHDRSTFAVSDGRFCEFTRVLAWGGQSLNVAIARALDATPSEAAPLKHAMSLLDDTVALEGIDPQRAAAACAAVRDELQAFARELVSSLRFYQNQPGSLPLGELTLAGGTAALPGLAGELERLVGVAVRVGDPLARVKLGKRVPEEQEPSAAIAIGLGIED